MGKAFRVFVWLAVLLALGAGAASVRAESKPGKKEDSKSGGVPEAAEKDAAADSEDSEAPATPAPGDTSDTVVLEFRVVQSVPGAPSPQGRDPLAGTWFLELRTRVGDTDLQGNSDRSFLNPGLNHHGEVTLLRKVPVWDFRELEVMGLYRYTDNPRIDPEVNSLQRGYVRLRGPTFELNLGDYLTSYSRFSFNQNTKGLNFWKQFGSLKMTGTTGVFIDRWGSIFKGFEKFTDPSQFVPQLDENGDPVLDPITGEPVLIPDAENPNKPYTRFVAGYRLEQQMGESSFIALNFAHAADIKRSLPEVANLQPVSNDVLSFDTSLQAGESFRFAGELALAQSSFDSRLQRERASNYAGRFEISHRWPRFSWRLDYGRFMPNFFSANARQVQDLQDFSARGTIDIGTRTVVDLSFRQTSDNLPGLPVIIRNPDSGLFEALTNKGRAPDLDGDEILDAEEILNFISDINGEKLTTTVVSPEARLSVRSLPPHGSLNFAMGYRERRFKSSNQGSFQTDAESGVQTPLFRERVTRIPFLDLGWRLGSTLLDFSYEYRQNRDRVESFKTTLTNRLMGSYRGSYFLGNWVVEGSFRFETEPEAKSIECTEKDRQNFTGNTSPCFLVSAVDFPVRDQTRSYQGYLSVDFPKYLTLELIYRELNAKLLTSFTKEKTDVNGMLATVRFFGNGGYRRPYGRAALTYKFANSENVRLIASFDRSVNTFLNPNPVFDPLMPDERSFRESVFQVEFVWRWER